MVSTICSGTVTAIAMVISGVSYRIDNRSNGEPHSILTYLRITNCDRSVNWTCILPRQDLRSHHALFPEQAKFTQARVGQRRRRRDERNSWVSLRHIGTHCRSWWLSDSQMWAVRLLFILNPRWDRIVRPVLRARLKLMLVCRLTMAHWISLILIVQWITWICREHFLCYYHGPSDFSTQVVCCRSFVIIDGMWVSMTEGLDIESRRRAGVSVVIIQSSVHFGCWSWVRIVRWLSSVTGKELGL